MNPAHSNSASLARFTAAIVVILVSTSARADHAVYVETYQPWSATTKDVWQTKDLAASPFFVPANAVVEVAILNSAAGNERSGGVRAVGSALNRRISLKEAEADGDTILVMHCQADASSDIQHYSDELADITFVLVGYWRCGTYVERFDLFAAGGDNAWRDRDLNAYGVSPSEVAEIVALNDKDDAERYVGVRTEGSSLDRRVELEEGEGGGYVPARFLVKADSSSNARIEVYAQKSSEIDFYHVGYWSSGPGAFTELIYDVGGPSVSATWQDKSLAAAGVPNHAVAVITLANGDTDEEAMMGLRKNGTTIDRWFDTQEAEAGGFNVSSMHVRVDANQTIEVYHEIITATPFKFNVTGYWEVVPYDSTDLGSLAGDPSQANGINLSSQIACFDESSSDIESAWRWVSGVRTSLGGLGGTQDEARDINAAGKVTGWSEDASGFRRAYLWTSGSGMADLGVLTDRTDSQGYAVNASDEVVGVSHRFGADPLNALAFLYLPTGAYSLPAGMNSLGTLGGRESYAMGINDSGQVVGGAQRGSAYMKPFLWLPASAYGLSAGMNDLGTLGGQSDLVTHRAEDINASGQVVGMSFTSGGDAHAFLWLPSTAYGLPAGMNDLGTLTGGSTSWAMAINDDGEIVGTSDATGGAFHAFLWETGTMAKLSDLVETTVGWTVLSRATDINNDGKVVGWGTNGSSQVRGFLLEPACNTNAALQFAPGQDPNVQFAAPQDAAVATAACGVLPMPMLLVVFAGARFLTRATGQRVRHR